MLALLQASTKLPNGFPRGCWLNILDFLEKVRWVELLKNSVLINSNPLTTHFKDFSLYLHFSLLFKITKQNLNKIRISLLTKEKTCANFK